MKIIFGHTTKDTWSSVCPFYIGLWTFQNNLKILTPLWVQINWKQESEKVQLKQRKIVKTFPKHETRITKHRLFRLHWGYSCPINLYWKENMKLRFTKKTVYLQPMYKCSGSKHEYVCKYFQIFRYCLQNIYTNGYVQYSPIDKSDSKGYNV